MNEFESAKGDFEKVLEVNPQNKAARLQISMCQKKAKEHNERDRRIYANMFKKFAEQDAKVHAEPTHLQVRGEWADRASDFHPEEVSIGHRPRKTTQEATRREKDFRAHQGGFGSRGQARQVCGSVHQRHSHEALAHPCKKRGELISYKCTKAFVIILKPKHNTCLSKLPSFLGNRL